MSAQRLVLADLRNEAHELHIKHLGAQMLAAHAAYEISGCFADIGKAHGLRIEMQRAIAQRSPDYIVALEAKRGLICA